MERLSFCNTDAHKLKMYDLSMKDDIIGEKSHTFTLNQDIYKDQDVISDFYLGISILASLQVNTVSFRT